MYYDYIKMVEGFNDSVSVNVCSEHTGSLFLEFLNVDYGNLLRPLMMVLGLLDRSNYPKSIRHNWVKLRISLIELPAHEEWILLKPKMYLIKGISQGIQQNEGQNRVARASLEIIDHSDYKKMWCFWKMKNFVVV